MGLGSPCIACSSFIIRSVSGVWMTVGVSGFLNASSRSNRFVLVVDDDDADGDGTLWYPALLYSCPIWNDAKDGDCSGNGWNGN